MGEDGVDQSKRPQSPIGNTFHVSTVTGSIVPFTHAAAVYEESSKIVPMGQKYVNALTGATEPANIEIGPYNVKVLTTP